MSDFTFQLTDEEKRYLKDLVRASIQSKFAGRDVTPSDPPTDTLRQEYGAFVTLKIGGELRGCIGHIVGDKPLYLTVWEMARSAAFGDPRFPPLNEGEFAAVDWEISIMSPITLCPDPELVEIGRHGLIVQQGVRSGLLLPQVPVEWNWDRQTFLEQTCRKAGLPANAWRESDTRLLWFEAVVF